MFFLERLKARDLYRRLSRPQREFLAISLILAALLAVFFWRTILFNLVPSPADLLGLWPMFHVDGHTIQNYNFGDAIDQYEPWYIYNYQSFRDLRIPLWNPYGGGGVPHVANMQSSIFFFLTWPFYILGFSGLSLLIFYAAKFFLTGLFSFYYLRSVKLRFYPSLAGAIGFMFVGFGIVWMQWPSSNILFLIPAALFLAEKIVEKGPRTGYFLGITGVFSLGVLSGHPETFIYVPPLAFLYLLVRLWSNGSKIATMLEASWKYMAFSLLSLGIAAVQLLPTVEYLLNSYGWMMRTGGDFAAYLPWQTFILNFMQDYYGTSSALLRTPYYTNVTLYQSSAGYVGVTLLCLALFAIVSRYGDRLVQFYLLLFVWTAGTIYHAPLIYDITTSIPILAQANNSRTLYLLGFCVVVLGSMGLNEVLARLEAGDRGGLIKKFSISGLAILFAFLFLAVANGPFLEGHYSFLDGVSLIQAALVAITAVLVIVTVALAYLLVKHADAPRLKNAALIGLVLLVFMETGIHGSLYQPFIGQELFHQGDNPFAYVVDQGGLYRTTSIDPVNQRGVYPANIQMIYGVYDIRDYDAIEVLDSKELLESCAIGRISGWTDLSEVNKNYLDFMGVKWVYSGTDMSKSVDLNVSGKTDTVSPGTGRPVIEEFTAKNANLSGIELLYSFEDTGIARPNVTLKLIDKSTNAIARSLDFDPDGLDDDRWYLASFEPLNDSGNRTYLLMVSVDSDEGSGVSLWEDRDLPGAMLYIGGRPVNGSLSMRTYYDDDTGFDLVERYAGYYLLENDGAMPRAFIARNATFTRDDSRILSALSDPAANWSSPLLVYGDADIVGYPEGNSSVTVGEYRPEYVKIMANTSTPGFLVLTDTYYPGWNAYVNGKKADILRADYAFRAVRIDAGQSVVEFKYEPVSFYVGALISALSLLVLIGIGILCIKKYER